MRGDPRIEIGRISRVHGIRGEVVIVTHDPASDLLDRLETLWVGGTERRVAHARNTQRGWLVQLEGVVTRNDAEALRGQIIEVDRATLELEDDEVLLDDLIGCEVHRVDGRPWGTITAIEGGLQDRLVIQDGDVERELPLVDEFVVGIDLDAGVVTVDPPDGLPEQRVTAARRSGASARGRGVAGHGGSDRGGTGQGSSGGSDRGGTDGSDRGGTGQGSTDGSDRGGTGGSDRGGRGQGSSDGSDRGGTDGSERGGSGGPPAGNPAL